MHTNFSYLYRDSGNYKEFFSVVLNGEVTINELNQFLYEGTFFVPSVIGLPNLQTTLFTPFDHIWHEIEDVSSTEEAASIDIDARELLSRFKKAASAEWFLEKVFAQKNLL